MCLKNLNGCLFDYASKIPTFFRKNQSFRKSNTDIIIIIVLLTSVFHACMGWTVSYERCTTISFFVDFPFRSILNNSGHVFLNSPLGKLLLTLKVVPSSNLALSSILSRWPNQCSFLSCKHSFMFFNFNLVLIPSATILFTGLMLHIHLAILASFLCILIASPLLTVQVSLPYSIISRHWPFNYMPGPSSAVSVCWFLQAWHLNLLYSFSLLLKPHYLLCTQHLQNWQRMVLLPIPFL